ncbi:transporter [Streptomyces hoynatensis]|uniref:Transporter n=1 Tax=Streptomyces hoynatensis TaxID=1141874 RepID=A0A3A9Z1X9_9ACTN|nr:transporter [Streptomyces hoynatensis]
MTATFVRLKLSLLRNGLRQSTGRSAAFLGSVLVALLFGGLGLLGLVALRGHAYAEDVGIALVAVVALGWTFMPMFVGGGDETLDPGRLAMLPLPPRTLLGAELVASAVGTGALFTVLLVSGAAATAAHGPAGTALAVLAVPLVLLVCVTLSRALATANARLLTSRRGRDLAVFSGVVVAFGIQGVNLGLSSLSADESLAPVEPIADVLRWLPPATVIEAVRAAGEGRPGLCAAALAWTLLAWGLLFAWWRRTLTRLLTAPDSSTLQAAPEGAERRAGARGSALAALLPPGRTGIVMLRSLRYSWRDPKAKMGWVTSLGMGLLLPVVFAAQDSGSVYNSCWVSGLFGLLMYNQFGQDYSGFWLVSQTICTPRDALAELRGRALAIAVVSVPCTVVVVSLFCALSGAFGQLPDALGLALALQGAMFGVGAVTSARFPYSIPQDSPMKNVAPGQGATAWFTIVGGACSAAVVASPVIALTIWLNVSDAAAWPVLPVGLGYGLLAAWAGLRVAAPATARRLPEILTAVSRG